MRRKLMPLVAVLVLAAGAAGFAGVSFALSSSPAGNANAAAPQNGHTAGSVGEGHRPLLAVVGASFAAGVGAGHRRAAWPEDLARMFHWRLEVSADPGAGYVNPGERHLGPFSRLAAPLDMARTHPGTVIIQGGHDDIGQPAWLVSERVRGLIDAIRREAPGARLAVLTVFPSGNRPSAATWATDRTIVTAARQADPGVLIFDPLASHWHFPRIADQLHPTPAGHLWIAERLAAGLRPHTPVA